MVDGREARESMENRVNVCDVRTMNVKIVEKIGAPQNVHM